MILQVASYVSLALQEGGHLLCGGAAPPPSSSSSANEQGAYLMPTLIGGLDPVKSRAATEEIFGPVLTPSVELSCSSLHIVVL